MFARKNLLQLCDTEAKTRGKFKRLIERGRKGGGGRRDKSSCPLGLKRQGMGMRTKELGIVKFFEMPPRVVFCPIRSHTFYRLKLLNSDQKWPVSQG